MKLIILEGGDRVGKDTFVNLLSQKSPNTMNRHWSWPQGKTNDEKTIYQKQSFEAEFHLYDFVSQLTSLHSGKPESETIMVWNRSHLGELVYGKTYRNSDPDSWVLDLEKDYRFHLDTDIYLVYLWGDPEFIVSKDDGDSYSNKLESRIKEKELFDQAVTKSKIKNKLTLQVNNGPNYQPIPELYRRIENFCFNNK